MRHLPKLLKAKPNVDDRVGFLEMKQIVERLLKGTSTGFNSFIRWFESFTVSLCNSSLQKKKICVPHNTGRQLGRQAHRQSFFTTSLLIS